MALSWQQVQEPLSAFSMESSVAAMSSGLVSFCCTCNHLIKLYFLPVKKKAEMCPGPHIKTWSGSFHLALAKVALVPSCQNLSTTDCSWVSTFKKLRVNRAWFKALCCNWWCNVPYVFMFLNLCCMGIIILCYFRDNILFSSFHELLKAIRIVTPRLIISRRGLRFTIKNNKYDHRHWILY